MIICEQNVWITFRELGKAYEGTEIEIDRDIHCRQIARVATNENGAHW